MQSSVLFTRAATAKIARSTWISEGENLIPNTRPRLLLGKAPWQPPAFLSPLLSSFVTTFPTHLYAALTSSSSLSLTPRVPAVVEASVESRCPSSRRGQRVIITYVNEDDKTVVKKLIGYRRMTGVKTADVFSFPLNIYCPSPHAKHSVQDFLQGSNIGLVFVGISFSRTSFMRKKKSDIKELYFSLTSLNLLNLLCIL